MSVTINGTSSINTPAVTLPEGTVQSQLDTKLGETDTLSLFNASGSAPVYACRAWVNFNGTGTVAIRAGGNVSSITDLTTGQYIVHFTTAMPDSLYTVTSSKLRSGHTDEFVNLGFAMYTTYFWVESFSGGSAYDSESIHLAVFR